MSIYHLFIGALNQAHPIRFLEPNIIIVYSVEQSNII